MFQIISPTGHYSPPTIVPRRWRQAAWKQVLCSIHHIVLLSCVCMVVSVFCHHVTPRYLSVYFTPGRGTARGSFILYRFAPCWYMELLDFYIEAFYLQSKRLCHRSNVCYSVCQSSSVQCFPTYSFIPFKAHSSAAVFLTPVLLRSFFIHAQLQFINVKGLKPDWGLVCVCVVACVF